jgi:hypothetical protein
MIPTLLIVILLTIPTRNTNKNYTFPSGKKDFVRKMTPFPSEIAIFPREYVPSRGVSTFFRRRSLDEKGKRVMV